MASNPDIFLQNLIGTTGLMGRTIMEQENNQLAQAQARQGLQIGDQNLRLGELKLGQAAQAAQRQAQYQADVDAWIQGGAKPEGLLALSARYPEQADQAVKAWSIKDDATKSADLSYYGRVHNAANNNRPDLVVGLLRQRRDAEKARGVDTSEADQMLAMLESPDEADKKQALATIKGWSLIGLSAADPVRFAQNNKAVGGEVENGFTLSPGARRFDKDGKLIAEAPFAPRPVTVGEGQTVVEYDPNTGGGGPASSGSGGGGNGDPYNTVVGFGRYGEPPKPLTSMSIGEVIQFGRDTLIPNTKAQGVGRDARGVLGSSAAGAYQITGETLRKYGPRVLGDGWQNQPFTPQVQDRIAEAIFHDNKEGNLKQTWAALPDSRPGAYKDVPWQQMKALIRAAEVGDGQRGGSGRVIAQGGQRAQAGRMTPQEVQAEGLDPSVTYYRNKDGIPVAVSGQNTRPPRVVPQKMVDSVEEQVQTFEVLRNSARTFKDNYGGNLFGDAENFIQGVTGGVGTPGQRDWWANFRTMDNAVRNNLFGATLTPSEQAAYEATTITPRMASSEIKKNLNRRISIVEGALRRRRNFLERSGYDPESVDALFADSSGRTIVPAGQGRAQSRQSGAAGSSAANPVAARSRQQVQALPSGTWVRTPDGRVGQKR